MNQEEGWQGGRVKPFPSRPWGGRGRGYPLHALKRIELVGDQSRVHPGVTEDRAQASGCFGGQAHRHGTAGRHPGHGPVVRIAPLGSGHLVNKRQKQGDLTEILGLVPVPAPKGVPLRGLLGVDDQPPPCGGLPVEPGTGSGIGGILCTAMQEDQGGPSMVGGRTGGARDPPREGALDPRIHTGGYLRVRLGRWLGHDGLLRERSGCRCPYVYVEKGHQHGSNGERKDRHGFL